MSNLNNYIDDLHFQRFANRQLSACEMGEVYVQYLESENFHLVDSSLETMTKNILKGFGLRQITGEEQTYFYSTNFDDARLDSSIGDKNYPVIKSQNYYSDFYFLNHISQSQKIELLKEIDEYIRAQSSCVTQVNISLFGKWEHIKIYTKDLPIVEDIRPLTRLNILVTVKKGDRIEKGSFGLGGRYGYSEYLPPTSWKKYADQALAQALTNLEAIDCPAGKMKLVLGSGWPGVLLHEAIGHGLEGDAHRKKTSVFTELMNEKIADSQVSVIDSGILPNKRGSINVDDEGTSSQETVLIENGKLIHLMYDRFNAKLMGTQSTGNGRRENFMHLPMPRMTNTYMVNGQYDPDEIIASVDQGIYACQFSGGQVDITSGNFVFSASEAYLIENGKITRPVKGMTLIGDGAEALKKIKMVGNDSCLDEGIGTCGKNGQSVPVGVGQPTLRIDGLTVGGSDIESHF